MNSTLEKGAVTCLNMERRRNLFVVLSAGIGAIKNKKQPKNPIIANSSGLKLNVDGFKYANAKKKANNIVVTLNMAAIFQTLGTRINVAVYQYHKYIDSYHLILYVIRH